eukprot:c25025_g3_i1 orf=1364-2815(+)
MEGRRAQMVDSCKGLGVQENKASAGVELKSIGVLNSGLMYEPMAETYHRSLPHTGYIMGTNLNTANPQLKVVNGGIQSHRCEGAAEITLADVPLPASLAFPLANALSNERNQLGFGPPLYGNGEMGSRRAMCHISQPSHAQCNKLDVQLSEVCQRRFVMFDHSGSKRRMIFHPAMMNKFPTLLPSSLQKPGSYYLDTLLGEAVSRKDTVDRSPISACVAPVGASFPHHNCHLLPVNTRFNSLSSSALDKCDAPLLSVRENAEAKREQNLECTQELSCYSHENTEDLEALLSSDEDEVSSTGHSPSDLTRNNSPEDSHSNSEGYSVCVSRKRKQGAEGCPDDDTCSTATSGNKMCKERSCQYVDGAGTDQGYGKEDFASHKTTTHFKDLGYGKDDLTAFDMFLSDEVSSSSSANNQKSDKKLPCMQQQPDGQSRKEKIKNILGLLRGIIPGGESMGTAFVLDEAIQYVRTLQFEVQKLQARKPT